MISRLVLFLSFIFFQSPVLAANSSYAWDSPIPVNPKSVFFGETAREKEQKYEEERVPARDDKSYPWYYLEKGNGHFLKAEYERAEASYREAYSVGGPTRVLSGFKLVETLEKMGRVDSALEALDDLEKKYLVSPREFQEAKKMRMDFLDKKRKGAHEKKIPSLTGREWLLQLSEWRIHFVLTAMDYLRNQNVPVKESYQKYIFILDEYFLAHPEESASSPPDVLAVIIYERDPEARAAIDRWKRNLEFGVTGTEFVDKPSKTINSVQTAFTGAEWITMVHEDKLKYVSEAMEMLARQRVPMRKSLYAYVDALDKLFTEKPELRADDSVIALASYLYQTEPEARNILEALRLE